MRAMAISLSALLVGAGLLSAAGAQAVPTDSATPVAGTPSGIIQLAGAPNKLGDKYMAGQAGGRYGIGGTEHDKAKGGKSKSKSKDQSKGQGGNAQSQKPPAEKQQ